MTLAGGVADCCFVQGCHGVFPSSFVHSFTADRRDRRARRDSNFEAKTMQDLDPDQYATLIVQQYLHEHGYSAALRQLERDCGKTYVESRLSNGSELLQLVYRKFEEECGQEVDEADQQRQAEEEQLLQPGWDDYPSHLHESFHGIFDSNIISLECQPGRQAIFVGTGASKVMCLDYQGNISWTTPLGAGGVLSMALHSAPDNAGAASSLLASCMDGSIHVLDAATGAIEGKHRPHTKYCVRALWLPQASGLISCGWDCNLSIHSLPGSWSNPAQAADASDACQTVWTRQYTTAVQDVALLADGRTAVAALRDSNLLRLVDHQSKQEMGTVNMNAMGDDHVSFSASHLALSPDQRYLLVSTDGPRLLMLRVRDWTQARNFYGLPVEKFHQPSAAWHSSGRYIMAAAAAGHVYIFSVASTKVVTSFKAHEKNVRALQYDADSNLLLTGSFDRTLGIYRAG